MCVVIVAMTIQRYNLASRNSLLLRRSQNIGNGVTFLHITRKPQYQPRTSVIFGKPMKRSRRSFSVGGPMAWNSLPDNLRDPSHRSSSFRRDLKTALFARYQCTSAQ